MSDDGKVFAAQTVIYYHNIESELCDEEVREHIKNHFGDSEYKTVIIPPRAVATHRGIKQALLSSYGQP